MLPLTGADVGDGCKSSQSCPWVGLGWVGLGQSADGLGWIGSHKMDPRTTLSHLGTTTVLPAWCMGTASTTAGRLQLLDSWKLLGFEIAPGNTGNLFEFS